MLQYLKNTTGKSPKFWQIELIGCSIKTQYGPIGSEGKTKEKSCKDEIIAFHTFKNEILKKFNKGYIDPSGNVTELDFLDTVFDDFLQKEDFEQAIAWLFKFGDLVDPFYEEKLINAYRELKKYHDAELYIFKKIHQSKKVDFVIRQVRYLSQVNPIMCRLMLGNLPKKPAAVNMREYYKNLAIAQTNIGMIAYSKKTLKNIDSDAVKVVYLAHLLDASQDQTEDQIAALENAIGLLDKLSCKKKEKISLYLLLSKKAMEIGQNETSERLLQMAEQLSPSK